MLSKKPWRVEVVLFFCAAQALCLFLGTALIAVLQKLGVSGFKNPEDFGNPLVATLSFQGATWILIPIFLRLHGVKFRDAFGLKKDNWPIALLLAAAVVVVILPVAEVLVQLSVQVLHHWGWKAHNEEAVTMLTGAKAFWMRLYLDFFAVVLAPVAEEFIFRGVLYSSLKQLGQPKLAFFGVSALFALIHGDAAIGLSLFVLALALTWLYEKTDNLLAPIAAHSLFNLANLVMLHFQEPLNQLLQRIHLQLS
jgi:membrane protease YdiL (CAAX protease family)